MSQSEADTSAMARPLPPNLVSVFTQALKSYQLSSATFRVLCSLTPSSLASSPAEPPVLHPPQVPPKALLVLDSSFNPPTLAHQRMAMSALSDHNDSNHKSRILLLLAINNADKAPKPAAFPQRLAMMYIFAQDLLAATSKSTSTSPSDPTSNNTCGGVDIAVTTEPYFHAKSSAVALSEFYRGTTTPAPETPGPGAEAEAMEQVYLTGFDTLIRIFNPKYYSGASGMATALDPFFARARLRVTMRTDAEWGDAAAQREYLEKLRRGELERVGGRTEWVERIEMEDGRKEGEEVVSSTKVRDAVHRQDWEALKRLVSEDVTGWIRDEGLYTETGV
ncbi:Nucleotidylyl transferase [Hypomontagnella monticulosa]|nr:Nucleotidylyl transferase [Hypomontagnella monticulosa]